MSKTTIECIVYACMVMALYHNWTDFPKPSSEVRGKLIKIGVE